MATFNKFNQFAEDIYEGLHNLGADVLKIMLTNTAPVATNSIKANLTEIGTGSGYVAGGNAVTVTASAQASGLYKLEGNDVTFTASAGSIGPFQYAVLFNDTSVSDKLIGWWDNLAPETLADGESFTVDFNPANGIIQHS